MRENNSSPAEIRDLAVQIRAAWANIGSDEQYGSLKLADLDETISALDTATSAISSLEDQMLSARNVYWECRQKLWDQLKHAKLAARLKHGDDSEEYERFGGTRSSQRKRPRLLAKSSEKEA